MLRRMKRFGWFSETLGGPRNDGPIQEWLLREPYEDKQRILGYLRSGYVGDIATEISEDVLSADSRPIDVLYLLSDGVWEWPSDLTYYMDVYDVGLHPDFLVHIRRNKYVIPPKR